MVGLWPGNKLGRHEVVNQDDITKLLVLRNLRIDENAADDHQKLCFFGASPVVSSTSASTPGALASLDWAGENCSM